MHGFKHKGLGGHASGAGRDPWKRLAYTIALVEKRTVADNTQSFVFEKPSSFRYRAGQHVRMTLIDPLESDAKGTSRFFSLASTPGQPKLEVTMRMRDSAFKRSMVAMRPGTEVRIEVLEGPPHGAFWLPDDIASPACFIAGGIGIVPIYSMVKDAVEREMPVVMYIFYSNRSRADAPFLEELRALSEQHNNVRLVATMTGNPLPGSAWNGETGRIDRRMVEKYLPDLSSPVYYLSGLPDLVESMQRMLHDCGVRKGNIKTEQFAEFADEGAHR